MENIFDRLSVIDQDEKFFMRKLDKIRFGTVAAFLGATAINFVLVVFNLIQIIIPLGTNTAINKLAPIGFSVAAIAMVVLAAFAHEIRDAYKPYLIEAYEGRNWMGSILDDLITEARDNIPSLINPDTMSLSDALRLLKEICRLGSKCSRYTGFSAYQDFEDAVTNIANQLLNYPAFGSYVLISAASTKNVQQIDDDMFDRTIGKYLEVMGGIVFDEKLKPEDVRFTGYSDKYEDYTYSCIMNRLHRNFTSDETNEAGIRQMRYNISKWLPVMREKDSERLEANYQKWFNDGVFTADAPTNANDFAQQLLEFHAS